MPPEASRSWSCSTPAQVTEEYLQLSAFGTMGLILHDLQQIVGIGSLIHHD